jgi:hypothetical protein
VGLSRKPGVAGSAAVSLSGAAVGLFWLSLI